MIVDRLLSLKNLSSNFRICTRSCINMAIRGCKFKDFCPATWSRCNYPPAAPLAAKTFFSFTKRLPSEILEKKNGMYQRIAQPILSQVLHFTYYNFSYLKHPNTAYVAPRRPKSKSVTESITDGPTDQPTGIRSCRDALSRGRRSVRERGTHATAHYRKCYEITHAYKFSRLVEHLKLRPLFCPELAGLSDESIIATFLDASSHLYMRVCPSVGRMVGNPFFLNAENEPFSI